MLRKGLYRYEYMDSWKKFDEPVTLDQKCYYSKFWSSNMLFTLSISESNSIPSATNHTIKHWVMVNLGVTWDQKFVPDITFFYIACITVSLVFVMHSYLLKSIKLFVFLYRSYIWMLVVISNFPFLISFFLHPAPPIAKTKCDYFFCWCFLSQVFLFLTD